MVRHARPLAVAGALLLAGLLAGWAVAQESRRFKRIPTILTKKTARPVLPAGLTPPPPPSRQAVESTARRVAKAYAKEELTALMAAGFPNKDELIDVFRRIQQTATNIQLEVESIEGIQVGPWQAKKGQAAGKAVAVESVCVVDVRTRLAYDDVRTGQRTVRPAGRAQWQFAFSEVVKKR